MTTPEKRQFRRVPWIAPVQLESEGANYTVECRNISVGGMLVRSDRTLPENKPLKMRFQFPGAAAPLVVTGTVQHSSPDAFMGIRFGTLPAQALAAIEDFINSNDKGHHKPAKRILRRVPIVAKVEAQTGGFPFIALAENISEGGVLIRTANPLEDGAVVHLKFTLPNAEKEITVSGHVRHVAPGSSMGVQFDDLDPADHAAIRKFVETV